MAAYPVGKAPDGRTIYSDGSRGWTQWQSYGPTNSVQRIPSFAETYSRPIGGGFSGGQVSPGGGASTSIYQGGGGQPKPQLLNFAPQGGDQGGGEDPYAQIRSDISSAWDSYLGSLGQQEGFIGDQRTAQEKIANSQLAQGQTAIGAQKASSLRDIANTTRSAFQAGNNYLGSLGAGDSSGANQYSFAINQQAGKQTGDLNNFVTGKLSELQSTHDQQVQGIAQWFANAQQQLKQQIAQGGLQKGQDLANLSRGILDQAIQATNSLKANTQNQYNSLVQWAASNSQNLGQLTQSIAGIPQAMGQISLGAGGVGGGGGTYYPGANAQTKTDIFGNPIR